MRGKRICVAFSILAMLLIATIQIPRAFAQDKEETHLGTVYTTEVVSYHDHVVSNGFGADISIYLPTGLGEVSFTKIAFAASLGSSWSEGTPGTLSHIIYTPFVGNMWVKVAGNSYFWPNPNAIVSNTGTGGNCTIGWELLLTALEFVLPYMLEKLFASPPQKEWQSDAHWVKAIVSDNHWDPCLLQTAAANFYSVFEQCGQNALTLTAGADIYVEWFCPMAPNVGEGQIYVGSYLIGGQVNVFVGSPKLSISASSGGTTDPAPGVYTYSYGSSVSVWAYSDLYYGLDYWLLDGVPKYVGNPITVTMDNDHTLKAIFKLLSGSGGDGCPTLFVLNGNGYVDYGVINIHNPSGADVVKEVPIQAEDVGISGYKAKFRLREGWHGLNFSESVIDYVKLYAVVDGAFLPCPLINATHSTAGNVLPQLLLSDDWKIQTLLLETIDLTFIMPYQNIQSYTFTIEGCNQNKQ